MSHSSEIFRRMAECGVFFWDASAEREYTISENFRDFLKLDTCKLGSEIIKGFVSKDDANFLLSPIHQHQKTWALRTQIGNTVYTIDFYRNKTYTDERGVLHAVGTAQVSGSFEAESTSFKKTKASLNDRFIDTLRRIGHTEQSLYEQIPELLKTFKDQLPTGMQMSVWQRLSGNLFCCIASEGESGLDKEEISSRIGRQWNSTLFSHICDGHGLKLMNNITELEGEWREDVNHLKVIGCNAAMAEAIRKNNTDLAWGLVTIASDTGRNWTEGDKGWLHMMTETLSVIVAQSAVNDRLHRQIQMTNVACKAGNLSIWYYEMEAKRRYVYGSDGHSVEVPYDLHIHRRDIGLFDELFREMTAGNRDDMQMRLRMKENEGDDYRWYDLTMRCSKKTQGGQAQTIVAVTNDVGDEVKRVAEEKRQAEWNDSIYNRIPAIIYFVNPDGTITYANEKTAEILGLRRREDLYGINIFDSPVTSEKQKMMIRTQDNAHFTAICDFKKIQESGLFPTKRTDAIELTMRYCKLYTNGHVSGMLAVLLDTTITMVQRQRIDTFNMFFKEIGNFAKIGVCQFDKTIFYSDQWRKNLAISTDAETRMALMEHSGVSVDDKVAFNIDLTKLMSGEVSSFRRDLKVTQSDGLHWISVNFMRSKDGKVSGISMDITDSKAKEAILVKAREKAESMDVMKSNFLNNVSHELRTPLNAIVGFSDLIAQRANDEEMMRYAQIVRANNEQLIRLVDGILEMSQLSSGPRGSNLTMVVVDEFLNNICENLRIQETADVQLVYNRDKSTEGLKTYLDKDKVSKIIKQLVLNAFRNTTTGVVRVWAQTEEGLLIINVSDTGKGLEKTDAENIFDMFVKIDNCGDGIGLGLPICKTLAQQIGGDIFVESKIGEGSHFWLQIPIQETPKEDDFIQNIIVVTHDETLMTDLYCALPDHELMRCGRNSFTSLWIDRRPRLTVIDVRACQDVAHILIKNVHARGPIHRVVAICDATYPPEDRQALVAAGVDDIISIPTQVTVLSERLRRLIEIR